MINVQNVTKMYKIYDKERERILEAMFPWMKKRYREFNAIHNVSFRIEQGEIVGIIGKNGSGKSTILKLITGILTPTAGTIQVNGKISALLELGTGFNMEYTGMENIYLSGTLAGIPKHVMKQRVEEIIQFADIGDFINQPVKNYSSGMFVRLAFAVAINVEPEILIVDEALSVGDAAFQAKCMSKMFKLMNSGTTILFVTHDMSMIKRLCQRCIYLEDGKIIAEGHAEELADSYLRRAREKMNELNGAEKVEIQTESVEGIKNDENIDKNRMASFAKKVSLFREGNGEVRVIDFEITDMDGNELILGSFNQEAKLKMLVQFNSNVNAAIGYHIRDSQNTELIGSDRIFHEYPMVEGKAGEKFLVEFTTRLPLMAGAYNVTLVVSRKSDDGTSFVFMDYIENVAVFEIEERKEGKVWNKVIIPNYVKITKK